MAFLAGSMTMALPAFGEPVEHHGMTVEANSPAQACISCHDGSVSHVVSFCTVVCDFSTSHSILKNYPPRSKPSEYASASEVQARGIKLVQGQVVCISCHDLRKPGPKHLVMSNEGSALCLTCHIKMGR
jgi:predicted CXXCH cytochrome family protein